MRGIDVNKVLAIACPHCGAQPGERCRTKNGGRFTGDFHTNRKGIVYPRFLLDDQGRPKRGVRKLVGEHGVKQLQEEK
jgi:hypothetical protein